MYHIDFMNREECKSRMSPRRVGSSPKGGHSSPSLNSILKKHVKSHYLGVRQNLQQSQERFACVGGTGEVRPPCMCERVEQGRKTVVYATLKLRNEAVKQRGVRVERSAVMLPPSI